MVDTLFVIIGLIISYFAFRVKVDEQSSAIWVAVYFNLPVVGIGLTIFGLLNLLP